MTSAAGAAAGSGGDTSIRIVNDISNTAGEGVSGSVKIMSRGASARSTELRSMTSRVNAAGTYVMDYATGFYGTASAINAFKFAMSSGNMTGELQIYGITK